MVGVWKAGRGLGVFLAGREARGPCTPFYFLQKLNKKPHRTTIRQQQQNIMTIKRFHLSKIRDTLKKTHLG
jgi:hypothetical protein